MHSQLERRVADFIGTHGLVRKGERVLLAVSGGADSTALVHIMHTLTSEGLLQAELMCVHVNHRLRSEADDDEAFVAGTAKELGMPVIRRTVDVRDFARRNKLSIETAARQLRIGCLVDAVHAGNCTVVATAHQMDDNAETIIQRLGRGTGFRGLGGIWPTRSFDSGVRFIRPLLCLKRDEIIGYLESRKQKWRVDKTNDDCSYRRNFIRHRLMPELQRQCSGPLAELLYKLGESSQRLYARVCRQADKAWVTTAHRGSGIVTLDSKAFTFFAPIVQVELLRRSLIEIGCGERYLTEQHYVQMLRLSGESAGGRESALPDGFICRREYDKLIFYRAESKSHIGTGVGEAVEIQVPGLSRLGNYLLEAAIIEVDRHDFDKFRAEKDKSVEWFDFEMITLPLTVRFRRVGDRFWPLGSAGEKKVGHFLTDMKVPRDVREKVLVVGDGEKVIWVWPIRMCEQAKVTGRTRRILELQVKAD